MPPTVHDWNNLENYLIVHERVLKKYGSAFSNHPRYIHEWVTDQYLFLKNVIRFQPGQVKIEITKHVEVRNNGKLKVARTYAYSYNVSDDRGSLLRYDSPHDHRPYHHRHVYDPVTRKQLHPPKQLTDEEIPHVSDVIEEVVTMIHKLVDV